LIIIAIYILVEYFTTAEETGFIDIHIEPSRKLKESPNTNDLMSVLSENLKLVDGQFIPKLVRWRNRLAKLDSVCLLY